MPVSYSGTAITWPDSSTTTSGWTGFKNRIINGAMVLNQRAYSATPSTNGTYTLDRWRSSFDQASKFSVQQSSTAPSGFTNSLLLTSTSAYTVGTNEQFSMGQRIEGYNIADLAWGTADAATVTLSFKVRSSLTGTFSGSLQNDGQDRSYPFTYTISAANTFETKSITIPGETSGTWLTTNGNGINLSFCIGGSGNRLGTANTWANTDYKGATGTTNLVSTNGATLYITGVQLERGSTASSFEYRPYGTELALCQRYCYVNTTTSNSEIIANGYNNSTSVSYISIPLPVTMRTAPSLTFSSAGQFGVYAVPANTISLSAIALNYATVNNFVVTTTASGITAGQGTVLKNSGSGTATITASAEL